MFQAIFVGQVYSLNNKNIVETELSEICNLNEEYVSVRGDIQFPRNALSVINKDFREFGQVSLRSGSSSVDMFIQLDSGEQENRAKEVHIYTGRLHINDSQNESLSSKNVEVKGYLDRDACELYALELNNFVPVVEATEEENSD